MDRPLPRPRSRRADALASLVLSASCDPADMRAWRRAEAIRRVRRGAYVIPGPPRGIAVDRRDDALAQVEAVASQLRSDYWFSHESAALIWGCDVVGLSGKTHVTQAWRASRRGDPNLIRHTLDLPGADRTTTRGLPVTTLERAAVDCAASLTGRQALVVLDSALRLGADEDRIRRLLDMRGGRRGVRRARRVVDLGDGRAESPGESLARWEVLEAGLPAPEPQVTVRTSRGTFRLDLAWRAAKVAIEFDGLVKYSGGFGPVTDVVVAEKRRQEALEEQGWLIIRVTWADLDSPDLWLARARTALDHRTPR